MAIQVLNTKDLTTQGVKCLVYGPAGSGKTRLCATAPRPIVLSAESGLLSIRDSALPYIPIRNFAELGEVASWVLSSQEAKAFDTICLDSISEIGEVVLADLKEKHKDPRKAYGEVFDLMLKIIRTFRDLPGKNVYFSSKQERIKDETTGAVLYAPAMPGQKLGPELAYFFDEVFQLQLYVDPQTKEEIGALRTRKDAQFEAKDRSGKLDPWEKPDLSAIFNKIMGVVPTNQA